MLRVRVQEIVLFESSGHLIRDKDFECSVSSVYECIILVYDKCIEYIECSVHLILSS